MIDKLLAAITFYVSVAIVQSSHCYTRYTTCETCAGAASGNCGWCGNSCVMNFDTCNSAEMTTVPELCSDAAATPEYPGERFFADITSRLSTNPAAKHYGVAVTDIDGDGTDEFFVTGFGAPNQAFSYNAATGRYNDLLLQITSAQDPSGDAIGVAACDVDEDGSEEIFVLNTDSYSGPTTKTSVRLYKKQGDGLIDLFSLPQNEGARAYAAGRSVACVDRFGSGRYGVLLANYGLPFNLYEVNADTGGLQNVAQDAEIEQGSVGGRALVSGPILSDFAMDIFANNENAVNWLMKSDEDGTFSNVASSAGVEDGRNTGRGTVLFDANDDGLLDIVYGNWQGEHRLMIQDCDGNFVDDATAQMAVPSPIRTVIVADFDNDGYQDIFYNNIPGSNRLFSRSSDGTTWEQINIGDAKLPSGRGTGAGVGDLDGDGRLELLVSHGESASQPLSLFVSEVGLGNGYLRIRPLTAHGAPARGATVRAHHASGRKQLIAIDSGSGYLCQQEPVAHFGLGSGKDSVLKVVVRWPNGDIVTLHSPELNSTLVVSPPLDGTVSITGQLGDGSPTTCKATSTPELGPIRSRVCGAIDTSPPTPPPTEAVCIRTEVPQSINDLRDAYYSIFKTGNRNAASHLWAAHLLDRACALDAADAEALFGGFCPVSGSPVTPSKSKTWAMRLPTVSTGPGGENTAEGLVNFCCSPCVCDSNDLVQVDTRTYEFADGAKELRFLVIGDPCADENALDEPFVSPFDGSQRTVRQAAPELACEAGKLKGAHFSDNGKVIIGLLREHLDGDAQFTDSAVMNDSCERRANSGYDSGMGLIFRATAEIAINAAASSTSSPSDSKNSGTKGGIQTSVPTTAEPKGTSSPFSTPSVVPSTTSQSPSLVTDEPTASLSTSVPSMLASASPTNKNMAPTHISDISPSSTPSTFPTSLSLVPTSYNSEPSVDTLRTTAPSALRPSTSPSMISPTSLNSVSNPTSTSSSSNSDASDALDTRYVSSSARSSHVAGLSVINTFFYSYFISFVLLIIGDIFAP